MLNQMFSSDPLAGLKWCEQQLQIDMDLFIPHIPALWAQVSNTNPTFRVNLLEFLKILVIRYRFVKNQDIRFAVIVGCLEAACYMMSDPNVIVIKKFVSVMTVMYPLIFQVL
jgi:hypothetical protein